MKKTVTILCVFIITIMHAQPVDPPADPDPPVAPIDNEVILFFFIALGLGYYVIQNLKKQIK